MKKRRVGSIDKRRKGMEQEERKYWRRRNRRKIIRSTTWVISDFHRCVKKKCKIFRGPKIKQLVTTIVIHWLHFIHWIQKFDSQRVVTFIDLTCLSFIRLYVVSKIVVGQCLKMTRIWIGSRALFAKSTRSYRHRSLVNRCHSNRSCHSRWLMQLDSWWW